MGGGDRIQQLAMLPRQSMLPSAQIWNTSRGGLSKPIGADKPTCSIAIMLLQDCAVRGKQNYAY